MLAESMGGSFYSQVITFSSPLKEGTNNLRVGKHKCNDEVKEQEDAEETVVL